MVEIERNIHPAPRNLVSRAAFAALLPALLLAVGLGAGPLRADEGYPIARRVRYGFTLRNTLGRALPAAEFWAYAPVPRTSTQVCRSLTVSRAHETIEDAAGNRILHFVFSDFPPYGVKRIAVEAVLGLAERPVPLPADAERFLQPEPLMPFDTPEFAALVPAPVGDNAATTPLALFERTLGLLRPGEYRARDRGALAALRAGQGDCTEFMHVFVALCRRQGIPARGMGGYLCTRDRLLSAASYHNWAEFHSDGAWHTADPWKRRFDRESERYVTMRILGVTDGPMRDFARFRFEGEGLTVRMED